MALMDSPVFKAIVEENRLIGLQLDDAFARLLVEGNKDDAEIVQLLLEENERVRIRIMANDVEGAIAAVECCHRILDTYPELFD